jgi:hypothetical protein
LSGFVLGWFPKPAAAAAGTAGAATAGVNAGGVTEAEPAGPAEILGLGFRV